MSGYKERHYKVAHAPERVRFTRDEILDLNRRVRGRIETETLLTRDELKIIQEQGEKQSKLLEDQVVNEEIDRNYAVPVQSTKTGERMIVVPKQPHPIFYEEHAKSGVTIHFCRRMCLTFCILLLLLNIYYTNMWIYSENFFPLEFFRLMFDGEATKINRRALEFRTNLYISVASFLYAMWGMSVSTVFTFPPFVSGFFTWAPIFIIPFIIFASVQVYNLTRLDTTRLKSLLFHTLWKYNYNKGTFGERNAWNQAQYTLKCCGVNSYEDWYVDWGYWLDRTDKPSNPVDIRRFPESCCPNYTLLHEYDYITRTRSYSIRMLYCQYYPKIELLSQGCFHKLLGFFQSFTEQLALVALFKIGLMAIAAGWAYAAHVRYKRHTKADHNYNYTCRDWMVDFIFLRAFVSVKDARKKRVGPALLHLEYDDRPYDTLERRRPHLIEDFPVAVQHLEEDEAEAALDEASKQKYIHLLKDPLVDVIDDFDVGEASRSSLNVAHAQSQAKLETPNSRKK